MRIVDLAAVYFALGAAAAVALLRRPSGRQGPLDLALTLLLWPLYLPALLAGPPRGGPAPGAPQRIRDEYGRLIEALDAVRDPTLAQLLPQKDALRRLCDHLLTLDGKVAELDEVLAREEFSQARAERLLRESDENGQHLLSSIRRLGELRARAARERDELCALCDRLRVQVTVLRFSGGAQSDVGALVAELLGRVEGAGAVFAEGR